MPIEDILLLKYISEDKELNAFFEKLSIYYDAIVCEKISKVIKPNLDKVSAAITKLEESGIILTENDKKILLAEQYYEDIEVVPERLFYCVKFSNQEINGDDIDVFKKRIRNIKEGLPGAWLTRLEVKFDDWQKQENYDSLKTEYEKQNKKYMKKTKNGTVYLPKSTYLKNLETRMKHFEFLREKATFFQNITYEQMDAIVGVKEEIIRTKVDYLEYSKNIQKQRPDINDSKNDLYKEAFIKILEQSLAGIDIKNIIKKIVVRIAVVTFKETKDRIFIPEQKFNFDIDAVNWFISFKQKEIGELFSKIFNINNFTLAVDTVCEKVLKK